MRDVWFAVRSLRRNPLFAVTAVLTLTLGIGANTAIYSAAYAILWNPLNLPNGDRLVSVMDRRYEMASGWIPTSMGTLRDWRQQSHAFEGLSGYEFATVNLTSAGSYGGEPERMSAVRVTPDFFDTLGVKPAIGRALGNRDDRAVVVSHTVFTRRLASDPNVAGKPLILDGQTFEIVGVMPPDREYPATVDLWLPMNLTPEQGNSRFAHNIFGLGRLKRGATVQQADAELRDIAQTLAKLHPRSNTGWTATVTSLRDFQLGNAEAYIGMLLGVVGFVLLIACANIANLQLARATGRMREMAIRAALGGTRWRLMRFLLTESLTLALAGAAGGILISAWSIDLLRSLLPPEVAAEVPGWNGIRLSPVPLAATVFIALAAGLISGLLPALQLTRVGKNEHLKEGGRGHVGSRSAQFVRHALVAGEIALAMVLLIGAGLITKGLLNRLNAGPRIAPESLLTFRVSLPAAKYTKDAQVAAFEDRLIDRLSLIPGVESAAASTALPHTGPGSVAFRPFTVEGAPVNPNEHRVANFEAVTTRYFQTIRIPLLRGREFGPQDRSDSLHVALINASMAQRYWPGVDPIGKRVKVGDSPWITIIGLVADTPHHTLEPQPDPTIYAPGTQAASLTMHYALRIAGNPQQVMTSLRDEVRAIDRELPIYSLKTMSELLGQEVAGIRAVSILMSIFGVIALALSSVGTYGVVAYSVSERIPEIGVRMALGASAGQVLRHLIQGSLKFVVAGVLIGVAAAAGISRVLSHLFVGTRATDPQTYALVICGLVVISLAATILPARRAATVDPMIALRHE